MGLKFHLEGREGIEPRAAYDTRVATMKAELGKIFCQANAFFRFDVCHFDASSSTSLL
jgi:hypothetical protein